MRLRNFYDFGHWSTSALPDVITTNSSLLPRDGTMTASSTTSTGGANFSNVLSMWRRVTTQPVAMVEYTNFLANGSTADSYNRHGELWIDLEQFPHADPPPEGVRSTVASFFVKMNALSSGGANTYPLVVLGVEPPHPTRNDQNRGLVQGDLPTTDIGYVTLVYHWHVPSDTAGGLEVYLNGHLLRTATRTADARYLIFISRLRANSIATMTDVSRQRRSFGAIAIWDQWTEDDPFFIPPMLTSRTVAVRSLEQGNWPATEISGDRTLLESLRDNVSLPSTDVSSDGSFFPLSTRQTLDEGNNGPLGLQMDWPTLGEQERIVGVKWDVRSTATATTDTHLLARWNGQEVYREKTADVGTNLMMSDTVYCGETMPDGQPITAERLEESQLEVEFVNSQWPGQ